LIPAVILNAAAARRDWSELLTDLALLLLALEILALQGRYLLNDVLGWTRDRAASGTRPDLRAADLFSRRSAAVGGLTLVGLYRAAAGFGAMIAMANADDDIAGRHLRLACALLLVAWSIYELASSYTDGSGPSTPALLLQSLSLGLGYAGRVLASVSIVGLPTPVVTGIVLSGALAGAWAGGLRRRHFWIAKSPAVGRLGNAQGRRLRGFVSMVAAVTVVNALLADYGDASLTTCVALILSCAVLGAVAALTLRRHPVLLTVTGIVLLAAAIAVSFTLLSTPVAGAIVLSALWVAVAPIGVVHST
jgi:hypothetical protein